MKNETRGILLMSLKGLWERKIGRLKFLGIMAVVFLGGNTLLHSMLENSSAVSIEDMSAEVLPLNIALYFIAFFVIKLRCNDMGYNFKQYLLSCVAYIIPLANIAALIFFCIMPGKEARIKAARALSEKLKQAEEAKKAEEAKNKDDDKDTAENDVKEDAASETKVSLEKNTGKKANKKKKKNK